MFAAELALLTLTMAASNYVTGELLDRFQISPRIVTVGIGILFTDPGNHVVSDSTLVGPGRTSRLEPRIDTDEDRSMRIKIGVMGSAATDSARLETGNTIVAKAERLAHAIAAKGRRAFDRGHDWHRLRGRQDCA